MGAVKTSSSPASVARIQRQNRRRSSFVRPFPAVGLHQEGAARHLLVDRHQEFQGLGRGRFIADCPADGGRNVGYDGDMRSPTVVVAGGIRPNSSASFRVGGLAYRLDDVLEVHLLPGPRLSRRSRNGIHDPDGWYQAVEGQVRRWRSGADAAWPASPFNLGAPRRHRDGGDTSPRTRRVRIALMGRRGPAPEGNPWPVSRSRRRSCSRRSWLAFSCSRGTALRRRAPRELRWRNPPHALPRSRRSRPPRWRRPASARRFQRMSRATRRTGRRRSAPKTSRSPRFGGVSCSKEELRPLG